MDKEYNKILKKNLPVAMVSLGLEPFALSKEEKYSDLTQVFVSKSYSPFWFFMEIRPHHSGYNTFVAKWSWSAFGRYCKRPKAYFKEPDNNLIKEPEMTELSVGSLLWREYKSETRNYTFCINTMKGLDNPFGDMISPPEDLTSLEDRMNYLINSLVKILSENCDWMFSRIQKYHQMNPTNQP
jgi:hypothetical protein